MTKQQLIEKYRHAIGVEKAYTEYHAGQLSHHVIAESARLISTWETFIKELEQLP